MKIKISILLASLSLVLFCAAQQTVTTTVIPGNVVTAIRTATTATIGTSATIGTTLSVTGASTFTGGIKVGALGTLEYSHVTTNVSLDFPSINANSVTNLTVTLPSAGTNGVVLIGPPPGLTAGVGVFGLVSSTNTVTIWVTNPTAAAINPAAGDFRVTVINYL